MILLYEKRKQNKQRRNKQAFYFQYENWKRSMRSAYFIDSLFILALTITFQIYVNKLLEKLNVANLSLIEFQKAVLLLNNTPVTSPDYSTVYNQMSTAYTDLIPKMASFIDQLSFIRYLSWIFFLYIFKDFSIYLYSKLRNKQISQYSIQFWLTQIATFFNVSLIYKITQYVDVGVSKADPDYVTIVGNRILAESNLKFNFWLGVIVAVQWIRVFMMFQASPTFGKLVEIIINMLSEIGKFMIILIIILAAFSSAGRILFFDVSKFQSDTDSMIYLISAALGNFDYSIFDNSGYYLSKYYGYIYQTLYLIVISITLLNFLIAILADIYTTLHTQSKGLHSRQILLMRSGFDNDPYYSSLVLLPVPLNIFMITFTPFIVLMKSEKLNSSLTYMWYTPVFLLSMIGFIVWNLIFLPFAYMATVLKIGWGTIKQRKKYKKLFIDILKLILFIMIGIFYFLFIVAVDTIKFAKSLFE